MNEHVEGWRSSAGGKCPHCGVLRSEGGLLCRASCEAERKSPDTVMVTGPGPEDRVLWSEVVASAPLVCDGVAPSRVEMH